MFYRESGEQQNLFKWAHFMESQYNELKLLHAIPNGGYRTKITAALLKAEGVKAGVSDIHLPVPRGGYASLYIELKSMDAKNKTGSPSQKDWIELTRRYGNYSCICIGWRDAADTIEKYLNGELSHEQLYEQ